MIGHNGNVSMRYTRAPCITDISLVVPMKSLVCLSFALLLTACGSSSSDGGDTPQITIDPCTQSLTAIPEDTLFARPEGYNVEDQELFLNDNATREGVVILESGLQYKQLRAGCGQRPSGNDYVTVHYHGTFLNGVVFDSSYQRGQPALFPVYGVIDGWVEALPMMREGDIWELYIPSDLAYGDAGYASIPPKAGLIFTVELLGF